MMARIVKSKSGDSHSYKVTLPKAEAEAYIEKYGKELVIEPWGEGWKLSPKKGQ